MEEDYAFNAPEGEGRFETEEDAFCLKFMIEKALRTGNLIRLGREYNLYKENDL